MKIPSALDANQIIEALSANKGTGNAAAEAIQIISALNTRTKCQITVNRSAFALLGTTYFHYMVVLTDDNGKDFVGHGRSTDSSIAVFKGLNESIERHTMFTYFTNDLPGISSLRARFQLSSRIEILNEIAGPKPMQGFNSSNGWAVHQNLKDAVTRALFEAIERHALQEHYWTFGLNGFESYGQLKEGAFNLHFSALPVVAGCLWACIVAVESDLYPGLIFGHQIVEKKPEQIRMSSSENMWTHAMIEAYQIAETFRVTGGACGDTDIDRIQLQFALSPETKRQFLADQLGSKKPILTFPLDFNLLALNIAPSISYSGPLYACWAYSESLFPLYLEARVGEQEQAWLQRKLPTGVNLVQGPFV